MRSTLRQLSLALAVLAAPLGCAAHDPVPEDREQATAAQPGDEAVAAERDAELNDALAEARRMQGEEALARPEHDPEAAHRARIFWLQGSHAMRDPQRVDEAIREFQLALQADPLYYKAHFKLGICYYQKGQYDLEIAEYKKCLTLNPMYVPAHLNLGHAYLARDMLEEAREAYLAVLAREPKNAVALYNLGLVEYDLRHFDQSYDYLDQFLQVHEDKDGPMGSRARMYLDEIRVKRQAVGRGS